MPEAPAIPLSADPDVQRYLAHARFEKRLAARTLTLYTLDLRRLHLGLHGPHLVQRFDIPQPQGPVRPQRQEVLRVHRLDPEHRGRRSLWEGVALQFIHEAAFAMHREGPVTGRVDRRVAADRIGPGVGPLRCEEAAHPPRRGIPGHDRVDEPGRDAGLGRAHRAEVGELLHVAAVVGDRPARAAAERLEAELVVGEADAGRPGVHRCRATGGRGWGGADRGRGGRRADVRRGAGRPAEGDQGCPEHGSAAYAGLGHQRYFSRSFSLRLLT